MKRRNFMKSWLVTGTAVVGAQAGIRGAAPTKPHIIPVAYNYYFTTSPLGDRGLAKAELGEIDLNDPLKGIAKLCALSNYWGEGGLESDQSVEIKPGATNKFTIITPPDPDDGWQRPPEEVEIKHEFNHWNEDKEEGFISVYSPHGEVYFVFTFKPEHKKIIVEKLGLEQKWTQQRSIT